MAGTLHIAVIDASKSGMCRIATDQPRDGSTGTRPGAAVQIARSEAEKQSLNVELSVVTQARALERWARVDLEEWTSRNGRQDLNARQ